MHDIRRHHATDGVRFQHHRLFLQPEHGPAGRVMDAAATGRWWWVGAHGGAGVSTLRAVTGLGRDAGTVWPDPTHCGGAVLVCRGTAHGANRAAAAIDVWHRIPTDLRPRLWGLVVVAGGPGTVPSRVSLRLLVAGCFVPRVWWIGWHEPLLGVDDPREATAGADVAALRRQLIDLTHGETFGRPR